MIIDYKSARIKADREVPDDNRGETWVKAYRNAIAEQLAKANAIAQLDADIVAGRVFVGHDPGSEPGDHGKLGRTNSLTRLKPAPLRTYDARQAAMPNNFGEPTRGYTGLKNSTAANPEVWPSPPYAPRGPVLYDGLVGRECLRRFTENQRAEGVPMYLLTPAQKDAARLLWSASLRARVEDKAAKDAERERLQVVCDDPDYYGTEG